MKYCIVKAINYYAVYIGFIKKMDRHFGSYRKRYVDKAGSLWAFTK